jgi:hypothetical protein
VRGWGVRRMAPMFRGEPSARGSHGAAAGFFSLPAYFPTPQKW